MTIYLVRHGETEWNREGRVQGHLNSPLTANGEAQARAVGEALRELIDGDGFDIVASPLERTRATARIIRRALGLDGAAIATDDRLREISWGDWDGLTFDEIEARDPGELARRRDDRWDHRPPGGESYAGTARRAADWLAGADSLAGADLARPLIAVSHGGIGRLLRGLYGNLPRDQTLALEQPQDAFHRLSDGQVGRIDTEA